MIRLINCGLFAALFCGFFPARAQSQSINAASCNSSDVLKAMSAVAADGTTVLIPAGNCTWTTTLTYTQKYSMTLQGAGAETAAGGTDQTIIADDVDHSTAGGPGTLKVITAAGKSFRLTGIAFYESPSQTTISYNGIVQINGYSQQVRIDDNHFYKLQLVTGDIDGWVYGVIDHNLFEEYYADTNGFRVGHGSWNNDSSGNGNQSWADVEYFGSGKFVFMEDNTFNWVNTISSSTAYATVNDCNNGGRFVFRHNTLNGYVYPQTHEMENDLRGCRAYEIYDNTANTANDPAGSGVGPFAFFVQSRMGTGLIWDNNITGYSQVMNVFMDRDGTNGHVFSAPPNGWGYCGTAYGPSAWDQNSDSHGYACIDQIGRGKGDLLTGIFPNKVNSVTGTISWPRNAQVPVYVWGNIYNPPTTGTDHYFTSQDTAEIAENREYYLELPNYDESANFNGTVGIGQGFQSARPSTCTPLVAYWATDSNMLYQCTATNTWTPYYTPYTYPHPLTLSSGSGNAPQPPAGLTATVQ